MPSNLRVVFVTDINTPYMAAVLGALARLVDLTVVFCAETASRGMPWQLDAPQHFRQRTIGGFTIGRGTPDGTDYHLSPRIFRQIWRERPDVLISSGYSVPTFYAALAAAARRCPIVIQSDGTEVSEEPLDPLQRLARRILIPTAGAAVANSERSAARFAQLGMPAERIFRAPHSTTMEPLWEVARRREYGRKCKLRLLTVGRLISRKGMSQLLRSIRLAHDQRVEVSLEVVGSGPQEHELRALAAKLGLDQVSWRGFAQPSELPEIFARADAFAFPTLKDPFGLVLLEAAATGLPLIASPYGGATADLVLEGGTGFERDPHDPQGWVDAIGRLASEPDLRESMGRRAYELTLGRTPAAAAAGYVRAVDHARSRTRAHGLNANA